MSKQDDSIPSTFPKKYAKILKSMPEFQETADAASAEDLKKIIVEAEGNVYTIEKNKEADPKLNAAKEIAKDISGSYGDARKAQMTKINYALFLLEGKGENLDTKEADED